MKAVGGGGNSSLDFKTEEELLQQVLRESNRVRNGQEIIGSTLYEGKFDEDDDDEYLMHAIAESLRK